MKRYALYLASPSLLRPQPASVILSLLKLGRRTQSRCKTSTLYSVMPDAIVKDEPQTSSICNEQDRLEDWRIACSHRVSAAGSSGCGNILWFGNMLCDVEIEETVLDFLFGCPRSFQ
jgi:hypothetical protein